MCKFSFNIWKNKLILIILIIFRYNNRFGSDGIHEPLTWEQVEDKVNDFKEKYIYPTIVTKEVEEELMLWWLKNKLSKHSYDEAGNNDSDDENVDDDDHDNGNQKELEIKETEGNKNVSSNGHVDQDINKTSVSS